MSGETGNFKSKIFGGFDRDDVVSYIEQLASERNQLLEENEKLRDENEALKASLQNGENTEPALENITLDEKTEPVPNLEELRAEVQEERRALLAEAASVFDQVSEKYTIVQNDLETTADHLRAELAGMLDKISVLSTALNSSGVRLADIRSKVNMEK